MLKNTQFIPYVTLVSAPEFEPLNKIILSSINAHAYPGMVVLASHRGKTIFQGVYGWQSILPQQTPMRFETIFDIASLTKVIVTSTAIMQLVEQGKLSLHASVAEYWPQFGRHEITIKDLLTHVSGLPPVIPSPELNDILPPAKQSPAACAWKGKQAALDYVLSVAPDHAPHTKFVYSDLNFIVLGELVERVSGMRLDEYAQQHIFTPLGMHNSCFVPAKTKRNDIAPTENILGELRWGEVHDPSTWLMGGVAGMAGVFSTAADLGLFTDMLLRGGKSISGKQVLSTESIKSMTSPQTPTNIPELRGLGWDISSPYTVSGDYFSAKSYGHTGYTGTSLWVDPDNEAWLIILSNRVHPKFKHDKAFASDRMAISNIIGERVLQS